METTNLSKIKRDKMLHTISEIKKNISDEETLTNLSMIENELTKKKYGLIWEEHEERVDKELETKIPTFKELKEKEIKYSNNEKFNFLLEGDNLHSLYLLNKTHRGKIDVIYIDPPYNTGKSDFVYNDKKIDSDDGYKHSKWLSFMEKRLKIASILLKETGVIFISIDENELYQLKILCDDIFGENNYLGNLIIQTATDNNPTQINVEHEYMICYSKNRLVQNAWYGVSEGAILIQEQYKKLKSKYDNVEDIEKELRKWIKENKSMLKQVSHYNNVDSKGVYSSSSNSSNPHPGGYMYDILHPITKLPCPKPANGWRWPEKTFLSNVENDEVVWGKDHTTQPHIKKRLETARAQLKSIIYADNRKTTNDLATIIGKNKFDNPKSVDVLKYIFNFCSDRNAIFLDFFAGSGTTGQAVLEMNKNDNGNRKFILCTNNENNICEEITYNRLKKIITGYKDSNGNSYSGLNSNLKYYKCSYVPRKNTDEENLSNNLMINIKNLIQLENGIEIDDKKIQVYLDEDELDKFSIDKDKLDLCDKLYISSDILLTSEQEKIFEDNNIEVFIIPEYYFEDEIMEVA